MSEIHIHDPRVRPESLCGYTGPPGEGDPTCAACVAVDENLVYPGERWDRIRERVVFPGALVAAGVMAAAALLGWPLVSNIAGVLAGLLMIPGIPLTLLLEYRASRGLVGEFIETEA